MGDPYPEGDARRMLDELVATANVDRHQIARAQDCWWQVAQRLKEAAERLDGTSVPSANRQAAWVGSASDQATLAFDQLAQQFTRHATAMEQIARTLQAGGQQVERVIGAVAGIGTELKPKPKGGLMGALDSMVDGAKGIAGGNIGALASKEAMFGGVFGALKAADAENEAANREQQFEMIRQMHEMHAAQMDGQRGAIEQVTTGEGGEVSNQRFEGQTFAHDIPGAQGGGGAALAVGGLHRVASVGEGSTWKTSDNAATSVGAYQPPGGIRVDGDMNPVFSPSASIPISSGYDPLAPGGSSGAAGLSGLAGGAAAIGGVGGALGAALSGSRAAGMSAGLQASGGGVIGGAAGTVGTGGATVTGSTTAAGARGAGGMGMMGAMGGGAGAGAPSSTGSGPRYGSGPQLAPRERRRRGERSGLLGAGSRGDGKAEDEASAGARAVDEAFFDE